ncbi:MAG: hypothetical protein IJE62_02105 [Clostridia bacterium]|nr:hypothetical protein [Clostridia bacterium]MBQ7095784.1 hypothetical protein [Clostridia bacterium]
MALWIALFFISGGTLFTLIVFDKKRAAAKH